MGLGLVLSLSVADLASVYRIPHALRFDRLTENGACISWTYIEISSDAIDEGSF